MRIEMVGHACLLCETQDARILMDPWVWGPSNYQSWWHIPPARLNPADLPPLDFLYISHLHDDHLHPPSLERLRQRPEVLVPRLYHRRLVDRLRRLGFTRIRELPHGREVGLRGSTRVCCLQVGNDSMLAVADARAAMLNANDALQGNDPKIGLAMLRWLGARYRFDIAFLAFGTAGPYPKCYRFEDPTEGMEPEVKERAMLAQFVQGAQASGARTVVPFAGNFALLAEPLLWMNKVKSTPVDALEALRAKDGRIEAVEMNPGDLWETGAGFTRVHPPFDWSGRLDVIQRMHEAHLAELRQIEAEQHRGPSGLQELFEARLSQNLRSFPLLRRRLDAAVLFDVRGEPGGQWEVDLRRPSRWFRPGDSGDWIIRLTIPAGLLAEVLTDPGGWEQLGISYRLDVYLRKGAREKEGFFIRLINTPSPWWLLATVLRPRFAGVVARRRAEFRQILTNKLSWGA
jgi:beta-lactamase family protein